MFRQSLHIAGLLAYAWYIYSYCQHETVLPVVAGGILGASFILRLRSVDQRFRLFERVPLFAVILASLPLGFAFRSAFPPPEEAVSPFPELIASAQSASIIAAVLFWLRPLTQKNLHMLLFTAWLTVTLSINVPHSPALFFDLSLFCLLSMIVIFLHTSRKPTDKRYVFKYYRDFVLFSGSLVVATIILFLGISRSVMILDDAYMNAMYDYFLPRNYSHFLNIDPKLNLLSPGTSAFDRRPVLEFSFPRLNGVYLITQVFRDYDNGVWKEVKDPDPVPVPAVPTVQGERTAVLTLFTRLKDIVPAPARVTAIQGNGLYVKDRNQIVYGKDVRPMRVLRMSIDDKPSPARLDASEIALYTKVPDDMAEKLAEISAGIVGDERHAAHKAERVRDFFKTGFEYSLNVDFRANNEGLIAMIEEKRPAYCTYFATAMSLLMRSQGVPARVATGFYTTEVVDPKENTFLARVRNAHAWVEVLLKRRDPLTGQEVLVWSGFDPTPPSMAIVTGETPGFDLERHFERFWLALLRSAANLQNIDREKAKMYVLYALLAVLFLTNARGIYRGLRSFLTRTRPKTVAIKAPPELQLVYRKYEQYLLKTFSETRQPAETDRDVVARLKGRPGVPPESITTVENFLKHYHAARFGGKKAVRLEELLK